MGFGGGPTYVTSWLIDWLIDLTVMHDWFILIIDIHIIILYLFTNPDFDSALRLAAQVRTPYAHSDFHMCKIDSSIHWFSYWLPRQLHLISRDPTLGT